MWYLEVGVAVTNQVNSFKFKISNLKWIINKWIINATWQSVPNSLHSHVLWHAWMTYFTEKNKNHRDQGQRHAFTFQHQASFEEHKLMGFPQLMEWKASILQQVPNMPILTHFFHPTVSSFQCLHLLCLNLKSKPKKQQQKPLHHIINFSFLFK